MTRQRPSSNEPGGQPGRQDPKPVVGIGMPVTGRADDELRRDADLVRLIAGIVERCGLEVVPAQIHEPGDVCVPLEDCDVLVLVHSSPSAHSAGDAADTWRRLGAVILLTFDSEVSCFYAQDAGGWVEEIPWQGDTETLEATLGPLLEDAIRQAQPLRSLARRALSPLMAALTEQLEQTPLRDDHLEALGSVGVEAATRECVETMSIMQTALLLSTVNKALYVGEMAARPSESALVHELAADQRRALDLFLEDCRHPAATRDSLVRLFLREAATERLTRSQASVQRMKRYVHHRDWEELWDRHEHEF